MTKALTIPVNGIYFDQIAAGTKLEEYRIANQFWRKRLEGRTFETVVMTRGYPKDGGVEGVTRLTRRWRGASVKQITHAHFGPEPVTVFAIDVSEPAQSKGEIDHEGADIRFPRPEPSGVEMEAGCGDLQFGRMARVRAWMDDPAVRKAIRDFHARAALASKGESE